MAFVQRMLAAWTVDGRGRRSITALVATLEEARSHSGRLGWADGMSLLAPAATPISQVNVVRAVGLYRSQVIDRNHGIRQANVLQMTSRIGFLASEFDPVWLAELDSFGASRGVVAHTSGRTQTPPDPRSESQTVLAVVSGLRLLDRYVQGDR